MKRPNPQTAGTALMQQGINPMPHLTRSLVGKGQSKNIPGRNPLISDKICNTIGNHPCFAGTGTGQYHDRPCGSNYSIALYLIEIM